MLLINRNYARLWYGQAISLVGDYVFDTTVVLWVGTVLYGGDRYAPVAVSEILLTVGATTLIVGPIAGVFVDRWDRRRTMLIADLVRAGLVAVLSTVAFMPAGALPRTLLLTLLCAIVAASTAAAQFFNPARFAYLGAVVPGDTDRARAAGIGQATMAVASIVGPPLAAPLLFTTGLGWSLAVNAASFVVSFVAIRSVRVAAVPSSGRRDQKTSFLAELLAGLRFFRSNRVLRTMLLTVVVVTCGAGALNALDVFFLSENLHADPKWYGTLGMGFGIGTVAGALGAGWLGGKLGNVRVFYLGLMLAGAGMLVYARLGNLWAAVIVLTLVGLPLGALNTAFTPILLGATPTEYLGRVMSVFNPVGRLAEMISVIVAGSLASTVMIGFHGTVAGVEFGRIDTIFLASGALILAGGVYAVIAFHRHPLTSADAAGSDADDIARAGPRGPA